MTRKFSILVVFCIALFGAILAGYWDMLDSEKLRSVREGASSAIEGIAGRGSEAEPERAAAPPAAPASGQDASSSGKPQATASAPAASAPAAGPAGAPQPAAGEAAGSGSAASAPLQSQPPKFDLLRVEPDGSAVMAGHAAPNAEVRLVDGSRVVGTAKASPEGDFAVVLDDRLSAGDHQIRIEAAPADGSKSVSLETAIVSVPHPGKGGELLAMVEAPDQPSRIISLPSAAEPKVADAAKTDTKTPSTPPGAGSASGAGGAQTAASAPTPSPADRAASDEKPSPPSNEIATREEPAAPGATAAAKSASAAPSPFAVEAVETENGTIYVAGRAPGTAPVRVYVDNKLLGEDAARSNGRFLVTGKAPLATGDHLIRADMVGAAGVVASRVEVPFAKPEGDASSAVASGVPALGEEPDVAAADQPGEAPVTAGSKTADGAAPGLPADATAGKPAASTPDVGSATAEASNEAGPATAEVPSPAVPVQPPTAASGTEVAGQASPDATAGDLRGTDVSSSQAANRPAAETPATAPSVAGSTPAPSAPASSATAASQGSGSTGESASAAATPSPSGASKSEPGDGETVTTIRQPALESVNARVLIRRGDTLWRISKDTYGLGRRYTVIYVANNDQIRNPNRIYPGQVFRLPKGKGKGAPPEDK